MPNITPEANPYAAPNADCSATIRDDADRDARLRHEYLGAILLAAICGILSSVMFIVSRRTPTSDLGEAAVMIARLVSLAMSMVSLVFVGITFRAAFARVWLLLGRIRRSSR